MSTVKPTKFQEAKCPTSSPCSQKEGGAYLFSLIVSLRLLRYRYNQSGMKFLSNVQGELYKMTSTTHCIFFEYHPQANDLVEHMNCTVQRAILRCIDD